MINSGEIPLRFQKYFQLSWLHPFFMTIFFPFQVGTRPSGKPADDQHFEPTWRTCVDSTRAPCLAVRPQSGSCPQVDRAPTRVVSRSYRTTIQYNNTLLSRKREICVQRSSTSCIIKIMFIKYNRDIKDSLPTNVILIMVVASHWNIQIHIILHRI